MINAFSLIHESYLLFFWFFFSQIKYTLNKAYYYEENYNEFTLYLMFIWNFHKLK